MSIREYFEGVGEDRTFLAILGAGLLLSLAVSINSKSFGLFASRFTAVFLVAFLTASAYRFINNGWMKVGAAILILLISGLTGFTFLYTSQGCLAWMAHSAENPMTGQCNAYVYGGYGPEPSPWYYSSCSTDSKQAMCDRLDNATSERKQKLESHLCRDRPDLEVEATDYSQEEDALELNFTEARFSTLNTRNLELRTVRGTEIGLARNESVQNSSVLLSIDKTGLFPRMIKSGDSFTVTNITFSNGTEIRRLVFKWTDRENETVTLAEAEVNQTQVIDFHRFR